MVKILIAEDDTDVRSIVHDLLEAGGFATVVAIDGKQTLDLVIKEKPDLLVLDLSMPEVDGWQVAQTLRKNASTKNLPILALTAHAMAGDCEKALKAGCDSFLAKPFSPDDLLIEIQRLLQRKSPAKDK
jgi:two-component system cell cycle response regulator DivK